MTVKKMDVARLCLHQRPQQREQQTGIERDIKKLRVAPPNIGSFGNGASLVVPGRRKCRKAVNGGQILNPNGPLMQAKPAASQRHPHKNAF